MYTIEKKTQAYIVSDALGTPLYFISHDGLGREEKEQDLLLQYLSDARGIFKSECDILLGTDRVFCETDAERLTGMLKLLIDARKTWQEEAGVSDASCEPVHKG